MKITKKMALLVPFCVTAWSVSASVAEVSNVVSFQFRQSDAAEGITVAWVIGNINQVFPAGATLIKKLAEDYNKDPALIDQITYDCGNDPILIEQLTDPMQTSFLQLWETQAFLNSAFKYDILTMLVLIEKLQPFICDEHQKAFKQCTGEDESDNSTYYELDRIKAINWILYDDLCKQLSRRSENLSEHELFTQQIRKEIVPPFSVGQGTDVYMGHMYFDLARAYCEKIVELKKLVDISDAIPDTEALDKNIISYVESYKKLRIGIESEKESRSHDGSIRPEIASWEVDLLFDLLQLTETSFANLGIKP
ncbi:MAG: hypothetical protein LBF56_02080 [Holosporales bacterium]|nr:hypothetical protein [Holosporales bacterium]